MARPARQSTARESPQLATMMRLRTKSATTAVDPTWSHLLASQRQLALSPPPLAVTSASILAKLRSIAPVQDSGCAAPASSSANGGDSDVVVRWSVKRRRSPAMAVAAAATHVARGGSEMR